MLDVIASVYTRSHFTRAGMIAWWESTGCPIPAGIGGGGVFDVPVARNVRGTTTEELKHPSPFRHPAQPPRSRTGPDGNQRVHQGSWVSGGSHPDLLRRSPYSSIQHGPEITSSGADAVRRILEYQQKAPSACFRWSVTQVRSWSAWSSRMSWSISHC